MFHNDREVLERVPDRIPIHRWPHQRSGLSRILDRPVTESHVTPFLDVTRFKNFQIEDRTDIVWGDREMCFPFVSLYAGDLSVDSLGKKRASRKGLVRRGRVVSGSASTARPSKKTMGKRPGQKVPKT